MLITLGKLWISANRGYRISSRGKRRCLFIGFWWRQRPLHWIGRIPLGRLKPNVR